MDTIRYLTIALAKGRLANKVMEMFETIDISCDEIKDKVSRKLIFVNEDPDVCFFLVKANDVPTYVEYGVVGADIMGRDIILEGRRKLYEVVGLRVGKCRVCICGPESVRERLEHHELTRVATKHLSIVKDYFYSQKYQTMEIIKLNGPIELASIIDLSEVIVDIVETGSTLRENRLMVLEEVCGPSAKMVINQVSMKTENGCVTTIVKKFQSYLKKNVGKWDDRSKSGKRRNVRHENRDTR